MKKLLILTFALLAIATSTPLLTSCDKTTETPEPGSKEITLPAPKYAEKAKKVLFKEPISTPEISTLKVKSIEFTETGRFYAICMDEMESRAAAVEHIISGIFVSVNNLYTITADELNGGRPFEIKVDSDGNITIGSFTAKGEIKEGTSATPFVTNICRTWKVGECKANDVKIDLSKRKEFQKIGYPTTLSITKAGSAILTFSSGKTEIATWSMRGTDIVIDYSTFTYAIDILSFSFIKNVTVGFNLDGTNFVCYLDAID